MHVLRLWLRGTDSEVFFLYASRTTFGHFRRLDESTGKFLSRPKISLASALAPDRVMRGVQCLAYHTVAKASPIRYF